MQSCVPSFTVIGEGVRKGSPKLNIWNVQLPYRFCGDSAMLTSVLVRVTSGIEKKPLIAVQHSCMQP